MKKYFLLALTLGLLLITNVSATAISRPPPTPSLPQPFPIYYFFATANNHITQGNALLGEAGDLLLKVKSEGKDVTLCEGFIDEARDLLAKAKRHLGNPIYANNLALEAIKKLNQAIDCLKV